MAAVGQPGSLRAARGRDPRPRPRVAELRQQLAAEAFGIVAAYNAEVAAYLNQVTGATFPSARGSSSRRSPTCPTARTPTSGRAFYRETTHRNGDPRRCDPAPGPADVQQPARPGRRVPDREGLHGADGGHRQAQGSGRDRLDDELVEAYRKALETDPVAAFGGIVGVNRPLDGATAREIASELVRGGHRPRLQTRRRRGSCARSPSLEMLAVPPDPIEGMRDYGIAALDFKRVAGGLLVETLDELGLDRGQLQVVTNRRPTLEELTDLLFAWRAVGTSARTRSSSPATRRRSASGRARRAGRCRSRSRCAGPATGRKLAVMASDAYFPFPDGIQMAARPASPRSSSPAARSATKWRSRSPTATTWRWCSPAGATSATER